MNQELAYRVWEWLPARCDSRRVTLPVTAASALNVDEREVRAVLVAMERAGWVIRNAATGRQTGWHRGTRPPGHPADLPLLAETEWTLY